MNKKSLAQMIPERGFFTGSEQKPWADFPELATQFPTGNRWRLMTPLVQRLLFVS